MLQIDPLNKSFSQKLQYTEKKIKATNPPEKQLFGESEYIYIYMYIRRNLTGESIFQACRQSGSQTVNNFSYSKVIAVVRISNIRCFLFFIFRRIKCKEEQQVINCWFCSLTDSVLKFLLNTSKTDFLKHFSIDIPVSCCPEKANFMQNNVCSWYLIERLSGWCTHTVYPRVI